MWYCAATTFRGARAECQWSSRHRAMRCASMVHGIRLISQSCDNKAQQVPGVFQAAEGGHAHSPPLHSQSTAQESGLPSEETGVPLPCRCGGAPCSFLACTCCLRSAASAATTTSHLARGRPLVHSALCAAHSHSLCPPSPPQASCTVTFAHALARIRLRPRRRRRCLAGARPLLNALISPPVSPPSPHTPARRSPRSPAALCCCSHARCPPFALAACPRRSCVVL